MFRRSPPDPAAQDLIALGIIRKAHGVRGEASVEPWTDSPLRFSELDRVFLVSPDESQRREVHVASARLHGSRVLVAFEEISTPEELRPLHDWSIEVPLAEARSLEEGEYFVHDLAGLRVIDDASGREMGVVSAVTEGGSGYLLTVQPREGRPFDMPFADSFLRGIDLEARTMRVDLPAGLEDLESIPAVEEEAERGRSGVAAPAERRNASEPLATPRFRFDLVTIFPRLFDPLLAEGILARAIRSGVLDIRVHDLRDYAADRHRSTDDEAYGGGAGMVMLAEPVFRCVEAIMAERREGERPRVVLMSPQGRLLDQKLASELSVCGWLVILCGRYEGFDERVREALVDLELSVGDFVVAGGEIPAMLVVEAVGRLVDGVVGDRNSVEADSFYSGLLDHPHYTRPAELRGMKVPEVLLSGHAERIRRWRREQSLRATMEKRPDLLASARLDEEAEEMLRAIRGERGEGERG